MAEDAEKKYPMVPVNCRVCGVRRTRAICLGGVFPERGYCVEFEFAPFAIGKAIFEFKQKRQVKRKWK